MTPRTFDPQIPTTFVFSHPNHELAVFGLVQRTRPAIVYLTDGGGPHRENQTREGLGRIGALERATFFSITEDAMYNALLERDSGFFVDLALRLRESLRSHAPRQIVCDAVEFYNPLHDITLPIVLRASEGLPAVVFEAPLVFQQPGGGERYVVQRPAASRVEHQIGFDLSADERAAKLTARDEVYTLLVEQMGPVITGLPDDHIGHEVVVPAVGIRLPGDDLTLRYEWRSQILLASGQIGQAITYSGHYLPVVEALSAA
jgi:hypothetical protein